jgi:hypothetical protein
MGFWAPFKEAVGPYDHLNECNGDFMPTDLQVRVADKRS